MSWWGGESEAEGRPRLWVQGSLGQGWVPGRGEDLRQRLWAGELAQVVERSLSMREAAGSMPAFSNAFRSPCLDTGPFAWGLWGAHGVPGLHSRGQHPGLHQEQHGLWIEGRHSPHLLGISSMASRVMCPALGLCVEDRCWPSAATPEQGHRDGWEQAHLPCEAVPVNVGLSGAWRREGFGGDKQQLSNAYHQEVIDSTVRPFTVVTGGGRRNNRPQLKQDRFNFFSPRDSQAGEAGCPRGLCSLHAWRWA